jgi:hypothetical protein
VRQGQLKLFVSPPSETTWTFDVDRLLSDLGQIKTDVDLRNNLDRPLGNMLEWSTDGGTTEVFLTRDGQTLVVDGSLQECAHWAIWARSRVPSSQPLLVYDEGFSADGPLSASTTLAEIIGLFSVA